MVASWTAITRRVKEYMIAFLVLETMMVGMFCALDFVIFYMFFEGVLIPMFLIIGVWGQAARVYAAFKFFLYTLLGSVVMLLAILAIYFQTGTTDIVTALNHNFSPALQTWLWLAFFASFAVKMPMWPVHTWLPDAHVEAPTAGSVILAGVLLKIGGYGFIRFSLPMLPDASALFAPLIYTLSVVAIIYTSLVALAQEDMKKLIAYSSVAHMGFVTIGIFTGTPEGMQGAMIQMLSHGIVSAALFLCVGVVYDRLHTREIARYGGLVHNMPKYAFAFMIFTLASIGLAGHQRLYRRVPINDRRLQDQHLGRVLRHDRHDPRRVLHALPLSPHHFWRDNPRRSARHARPQRARGGHFRADDRNRDLDGYLSVEFPASDAARHYPYRSAYRGRTSDGAQCQSGVALTMPIATLPNLLAALPEIFLAVAAMALLILGVFQGEARAAKEVSWLSVVVLVMAIFMVGAQNGVRHVTLAGMFITDGYGIFAKILVLIGSALSLILSIRYNERENISRFEFPVLVLFSHHRHADDDLG